MYRRRIHSICNCSAHLFPVQMRYAGYRRRYGHWVHVMVCPVSGRERYYRYDCFNRIRRVA